MRHALAACFIVLALAGAGCTSLSLTKASFDKPAFDVTPQKGDASTDFKVDAGALSQYDITWDFGDGKVAHGATADHKYGFTNGAMTITMLATDATGKQAIATRTVTLGSGHNGAPRASLDASPTWAEVGKPIALDAYASDPDDDPLTYLWTYTVLSGSDPQERVIAGDQGTNTISFDAPGKYDVKVQVRDPKGGEDASEATVDVSRHIPDRVFQAKYNGTLVAGTGGNATASETLWGAPAPLPDSNVDAARYTYKLKYPASTIIVLTWNDTSTQGFWDLDLELRNLDTNKTVFTSAHHPNPGPPPVGAPPFEYNFTYQQPGNYEVIVRATTGAQIQYDLLIRSTLFVTPELVNAADP